MPEEQYQCNVCGWIFPKSDMGQSRDDQTDCCPECDSTDIAVLDDEE